MAEVTRTGTVPAQGCMSDGRAPAGNPYRCDRCDMAETGVCGKAKTEPTAGGLAEIYDAMTVVVENDEPTTFTDDRLYAAAGRLVDALTNKLIAARHIRGSRPA